jgi:hypothetical protein
MGKAVRVTGYFGEPNGKSHQGVVSVSYYSHGTNDTLCVAFDGAYQVDMPFRPIESIIMQVRRAIPTSLLPTVEGSCVVRGYYSDGATRLVPGQTNVWLRVRDGMEMLTVEFSQAGQISIPFAPVEKMIASERRSRA